MDAYELQLTLGSSETIDEEGFDLLKEKFKRAYLNLKNYNERVELHRNPYEVKYEVLHELYAYLNKIDNRTEMRHIEGHEAAFVSTKIKAVWDADKRLKKYFDAIKKYCEINSKPFNVIVAHVAEYSAMSELAGQISKDIEHDLNRSNSEQPKEASALDVNEIEQTNPANAWNIIKAAKQLNEAFEQNSELLLLEILKNNSFLFYELYERKYGMQPVFYEVNLGAKLRCDFAWLNDNSDGPEWVLVEVEKPRMRVFNKNGKPTSELNNAIEQVKSWHRYFKENPLEKRRIFGAVSRFRYILIAGDKESWSSEKAIKWRADNNTETNIEIRSTDVFDRALKLIKSNPREFWSFGEHPASLPFAAMENYWQNYDYMDKMRRIFN